MTLQVHTIEPARGRPGGGELVRLHGEDFGPALAVFFGDRRAETHAVVGTTYADVLTPAHAPALVDVRVQSLDAAGAPVPGEAFTLPAAYAYARPDLTAESDLTALARLLLRDLKAQLLEATSMSVVVDYAPRDDAGGGPPRLTPVAELPALALSPPRTRRNGLYGTRPLPERQTGATEVTRLGPPMCVDVLFTLTGIARGQVTALNLQAAVADYLHHTPLLFVRRGPSGAVVELELHTDAAFRSTRGPDDVRAFSVELEVRGFDLAGGLPLERVREVEELGLSTDPLGGAG